MTTIIKKPTVRKGDIIKFDTPIHFGPTEAHYVYDTMVRAHDRKYRFYPVALDEYSGKYYKILLGNFLQLNARVLKYRDWKIVARKDRLTDKLRRYMSLEDSNAVD